MLMNGCQRVQRAVRESGHSLAQLGRQVRLATRPAGRRPPEAGFHFGPAG